jgi:hypothetical protein
MLIWSKFDDDQKAVLKRKNPKARAMRLSVLGPKPRLDSIQQSILLSFQRLRSQTNPDRAIRVPSNYDSVLTRHLHSLDRVFLDGRAEERKAELDKRKSAEQKAKRKAAQQHQG